MSLKISALLLGLSLVALSGCYGMNKEIEDNGRYWQRVDTTDSIYQRGPKAQQMLFQDQSRCVVEVNELARLGAVRSMVPFETFDANGNRMSPNTPEARLADYDSPDRDGTLRAEYLEYHDFETCMMAKGWERVKYVKYETKERARDDYLDAIGYERYRSTNNERIKSDYGHLNQ